MKTKTFAPSGANTVLLACTTTSTRVQLDVNSSVVRVYNPSATLGYIQFGDANVQADNAKMPIPPGDIELFTKGTAAWVAGICDSGTANLLFTVGEGM